MLLAAYVVFAIALTGSKIRLDIDNPSNSQSNQLRVTQPQTEPPLRQHQPHAILETIYVERNRRY